MCVTKATDRATACKLSGLPARYLGVIAAQSGNQLAWLANHSIVISLSAPDDSWTTISPRWLAMPTKDSKCFLEPNSNATFAAAQSQSINLSAEPWKLLQLAATWREQAIVWCLDTCRVVAYCLTLGPAAKSCRSLHTFSSLSYMFGHRIAQHKAHRSRG